MPDSVEVNPWVGRCPRCGGLWLLYSRARYAKRGGRLLDWEDIRTVCTEEGCYIKSNALPKYKPLPWLEDQAIYTAAYVLGGEDAVMVIIQPKLYKLYS